MTLTVAVFGATGAQGAPVVTEALAKGMTVHAVARDAAKITGMHPRAKAFAADLSDHAALAAALEGVDAAFFHLPMPSGPDDIAGWMGAFMSAAHQVKLPLMVYTTSGAAGARYPSSAIIDAATQGLEAVLASGIPTVALKPAVYLENLQPPFFLPNMRSGGVVDYPPVPPQMRVQWTSHIDQARIAVAALQRSDLAGQSFDIGSPGALTGAQLATALGKWIGRDLRFQPTTPAAFGKRVAETIGIPGAECALCDCYTALASMGQADMAVDTAKLEQLFGVALTTATDHSAAWPREA